jgi:hypothetical protein
VRVAVALPAEGNRTVRALGRAGTIALAHVAPVVLRAGEDLAAAAVVVASWTCVVRV